MTSTLDRPFIYSEIVKHTTLELMTKLTEYPFQAKKEALIEAQRSNAEAKVLMCSVETITKKVITIG